ncbi:MAG: PAS domain S-box protein [Proteobacteria bacterium]|nr:PAS domain S-box protein [Pseudomonadota bacterium]
MSDTEAYAKLESRIKDLEKEVDEYKLSYEAMRGREAIFEVAIESIPFDYFVIDEQGRYVFQNSICRKHWGDFIGKRPEDLSSDKETLSLWQSKNSRAFAGEFVNEEGTFRLNDKEIHCHIIISPLKENNRVKFIVGFYIDITERKLAEKNLLEKRKKLQVIFDLSPMAIAVSEKKTGKIINVNKKLCELTKYTSEEILGKVSTELGLYSVDKRNRLIKELESSGEVNGLEIDFNIKDGSVIKTFVFSKEVQIAGEKCFISVFYDRTEIMQAEEALQQSEEKYRQLAELLPQVVFEVDKQGTTTFVNRRTYELLGYTEDDFKKGINALTMLIPEDRNRALNKIQNIMNGEKSEGNEYTALRKDGSTFPLIVYSTPIIQQGQSVGLRGIMIDLTEVKQAYKALRENEEKIARLKKMEALGLLAGGVAHDLNNVLSGVVGYPELLLMDLPECSSLRKPIEAIQDSGTRAVSIVQNLLTLARGVATVKTPLNINLIIREYLSSPEFNKLQHFHPSVTINANLCPHPFNVNASDVHIRKAIMNLVLNAIEAIEGSGSITISTMNLSLDKPMRGYDSLKAGEYVVLSVSDNGSGISPDDLERIFDPFYTRKVMGRSGTGLGLSVVWNVVQDHEGYIDVITGEKLTTFELYFPITKEELSKRSSFDPLDDLKGNKEVILVVDDMESQREISCMMLDALGYEAFAVSGGEEAVEYLKENRADLILLDMIMDPGINGCETYEKILKVRPGQKAVIVSGLAETEEVKKTQKLGAGQFVKKPITFKKIGLAVKEELKK